LGFIGGLFGILSLFIWFVGSYNSIAYEISIGSRFFKPDDDSSVSFKDYNFFTYLQINLFKLFKYFNRAPDWKNVI
jgi:hypothetical protein